MQVKARIESGRNSIIVEIYGSGDGAGAAGVLRRRTALVGVAVLEGQNSVVVGAVALPQPQKRGVGSGSDHS